MSRRWFVVASLAAGTVASVAGAAPAPPAAQPAVAIENGRVHTGDGPPIEGGTVLIRGEQISAVGPAASVKVPDGARRIDAKGLWVTAGLFDAESTVGLADVALEPSTLELGLGDKYDPIRPAFSVVDGLNPRSVVVPVTRIEGITTCALAPGGGLVSGRGAVVDLAGATADEMIVRTPSAVYLNWGDAGREGGYGARGGIVMRVRELIDDARQYARRRQDYERNQMRRVAASRLDLEALIPAVEGKLPFVVTVNRASDIQAVLRLARQEGLKVVLSGVKEGWIVAEDIARAGVPVILDVLQNLPASFEKLGSRLDNAALLARAGVKIAISSRNQEPQNSRTIKQEAGNAVAHGLAWEDGLKAVTRNPAEMFGLGDRYGTLAAGKTANVVVWSGDPFETTTLVRHVFIRGRAVSLRSRQTELRDRYRDVSGARPRP